MCKCSFGGQRLAQGHMWFADGIEPMSSVDCSTSGPVPGRPQPLDGLLLHQSSAVTRRSDGVLTGLDQDEEQGTPMLDRGTTGVIRSTMRGDISMEHLQEHRGSRCPALHLGPPVFPETGLAPNPEHPQTHGDTRTRRAKTAQ